jgi:hypothetical protein
MKWIVRIVVEGPDQRDAEALIDLLTLLDTMGKRTHFSFRGWEPRRRG